VFDSRYDQFARTMKLVPGVKCDRDEMWLVPQNALDVFAKTVEQFGIQLQQSMWVEKLAPVPSWEDVAAQLHAAGEVRPEFIDAFPAPHQRKGVAVYWNGSGHFWVGTGGGKTWMGIVAATATPGPILLVTRSAARLQVAREIERFTTSKAFVFRAKSSIRKEESVAGVTWREFVRTRMPILRDMSQVARDWAALKERFGADSRLVEQTLDDYLLDSAAEGYRPWFVVGWEAILDHYDELAALDIRVLISDEEHLGKNGKNFDCVLLPPLPPDAAKARAQRKAEREEADEKDGFIREDPDPETGLVSRKMFLPVDSRATAVRRLGRRASRRLGMTATPVFNRIADLAGQLSSIEPNCWGSTSAFHYRYCDAKPGKWGGMDVTGESNIEELQQRLERVTFVVPTHEAQAHMLHLKRRQSVYVSPDDQISELPGLATDLKRARKEGGLSRLEVERIIASSRKRGAVISLLEPHVQAGHKCVIFTARKRDCDDIGSRIQKHRYGRLAEKPKVWVAHGDMSIEARDLVVQEYMSHPGPCVLVATGQSFGESLNLDDTDAAFFIQLPYTPGEIRQWEGRFFRMSTKRPVVIYYVIAEHTIDEQIAGILLNKLPAVEQIAQDRELAGASVSLAGIDPSMSDEAFAQSVLDQIDWDF
jgi:superfamily II DNA or RNA helicase